MHGNIWLFVFGLLLEVDVELVEEATVGVLVLGGCKRQEE
jgi:hypothetical protein